MDIYLMQHGAATSSEEDPARPLTPSGRKAVNQVAARAAGCGVQAGRCIHSGKLRAEQTAQIIGEALGAACREPGRPQSLRPGPADCRPVGCRVGLRS